MFTLVFERSRPLPSVIHRKPGEILMLGAIYRAFTVAVILLAMIYATQSQAKENFEEKAITTAKLATPTKRLSTHYSYTHRQFEGELSSNYLYQPESLTVSTHSFGLNYKISDSYSFSVSGRHLKNDITLKSALTFPGMPSTIDASTEGLSDTLIGVGKEFILENKGMFLVSLNLSLPTGNYQEKTSNGRLVSYQGQLGSGTYDFSPVVYYRQKVESWDFNARIQGYIRTGRNDLDYRLGDEITATLSSGYWINRYVALTGSLYYKNWREVVGSENVTEYNNRATAAARSSARPPEGSRPGPSNYRAFERSSAGQHGRTGTYAGERGGPPSQAFSNPLAEKETGDIFAASGARWSAQVGLKTGIYLGPLFRAVIEAGVPIYNDQLGPLHGLNTTWYAVTAIQSSF